MRLKLVGKRHLTDRIAEFRFVPVEGEACGWQAGAHLRVTLPDGGDRAYSLIHFDAVPEVPDDYRVAVQLEEESTGGSRFMHALEEGDEVSASAPKCDFPVTPDAPAVLLAGGIGITPLISMAAALKAAGTPVELHYAVRSRALMAYGEELAALLGESLEAHFDDDDSALDLDALIGALGDRHLYICGPRGLIDAARAKADAAGIPAERVHVELFDNASAGAAGDESFDVEIASTGEIVSVPADKTIIEALEEAGHDLMYDCQRGDCGICQTEVLEGVPDHRDVVLSEKERESGKIMQICVSRAKSPRLRLDL